MEKNNQKLNRINNKLCALYNMSSQKILADLLGAELGVLLNDLVFLFTTLDLLLLARVASYKLPKPKSKKHM